MITESIERRMLGALRFVDAVTGQRLDDGLAVSSDVAEFRRNRPGDYAIFAAVGLESHADEFDVPPVPVVPPDPQDTAIALGSVPVTLTVRDHARRYLARQVTVLLPRDADPLNATNPDSLFSPILVPLYPSPDGPTWPGWAVIRATTNLANALLRVVRVSDDALLGSGMTDERGEALVGVAGIPITTFSGGAGPVLATTVDVEIQVIADPAAVGAPDPDDLELRHVALLVRTSPQLELASGKIVEMIV